MLRRFISLLYVIWAVVFLAVIARTLELGAPFENALFLMTPPLLLVVFVHYIFIGFGRF